MEFPKYRRLPLSGLKNCRELGGYAVPSGITKYAVCLRSEVPSALTPEDISFLKDYGLTTVIDFRSTPETKHVPDVLAALPWINYIVLPMFSEAAAAGANPGPDNREPPKFDESFSWKDEYIHFAERHKSWVHDSLEAIAAAPGTVLYHCTTGKDRTGIISALLLSLCGVSNEDVIADYAVSQIYLKEMYRTMTHLLPDKDRDNISHPFFSTAPVNMEAFLDYIDSHYGGCAPYLKTCGISDNVAATLRAKLTEHFG